jgi:hypothetical protein
MLQNTRKKKKTIIRLWDKTMEMTLLKETLKIAGLKRYTDGDYESQTGNYCSDLDSVTTWFSKKSVGYNGRALQANTAKFHHMRRLIY